jgi:tetratricopeptide (TPR) repeat protein
MRGRAVALFLALLIPALTAPVFAAAPDAPAPSDPITEAEALSQDGITHYQAGRFKDAIASMLAAQAILAEHGLEVAPELLYNIARIYHKMGEARLAHESYTRFILSEGADPAMVRKALDYREQVRASPATPPAPVVSAAEVPPTPKAAGPAAVAAPATEGGGGHAVAYWVGGAGLAMLATGGVLGGLALVEEGGLSDHARYEDKLDARDRGRTLALTADVALATGAATLITATVLYFTLDDAPSPVALTPRLGVGVVGAQFMATF